MKIDAQCKKDYDDMHQRKAYSYLIFRISDDDTTIVVEKKGDKGAPYSEFVEVSPRLQPSSVNLGADVEQG